jgi:Polyketide cyclase / dehydrase and lipid transport
VAVGRARLSAASGSATRPDTRRNIPTEVDMRGVVRSLTVVLVMVCVLGLRPAPAAVAPAPAPALSEAQRDRLAAGDIVILSVMPEGGETQDGQGGTALAHVRAPADVVWGVLVNYPGHRGLFPRVVDAQVLDADARHALVRYAIGVGPLAFRFHVDNFPDPHHRRLDWRLAQDQTNGLFRDTWGYWQIDPNADGVLLTYAMAARTVFPRFLTRGSERDGLVDTLRAVRTRAEGMVKASP